MTFARCLSACLVVLTLACSRERQPAESAGHEPPYEEPEVELTLRMHPAVGSLDGLPPEVAVAFTDACEAPNNCDFDPMHEPGPDDWLSSHEEPGQTVMQFIARGPNVPTAERHVIYLQPIGPLSSYAPSIELFADYTKAFFGLDVGVLEPITVDSLAATTREGQLGPQLLASDVLVALEQRLPADGFLLAGLTMADLYPGDDWNFVFGYASLDKRVAVYSLLRFDPMVLDPQHEVRPALRRQIILERSLKLMSHELTHSFGMQHCVHFDCLMNGTNHLDETDLHPLHLCPVCLRKLHVALGFDPRERYERLARFYIAQAMVVANAWIGRRLRTLDAGRR